MATKIKKENSIQIVPEVIINKIYNIRGCKVILDVHLAELYDVETRVLKQAVKRNGDLFPADFMFVLDQNEMQELVSQNVIPSKRSLGGSAPFAFMEPGVAMLSGVLKSKKARKINIAIMRAFVDLRRMLNDNTELRLAIEELRRQTGNNSKNIELAFQYLDELMAQQEKPERPLAIGFKLGVKNTSSQ
jgi:hypothetical protein